MRRREIRGSETITAKVRVNVYVNEGLCKYRSGLTYHALSKLSRRAVPGLALRAGGERNAALGFTIGLLGRIEPGIGMMVQSRKRRAMRRGAGKADADTDI